MNMSESINEIAKAISLFQGEIKDVFKDKSGYGYKYADLAQVLELVRPVLSKYGLSVVQIPSSSGDKISLETMLMHESGQWINGTIEMPVTVGKGMTHAQACGSVISYARRYSLTSWLGIAQSDNDASVVDSPVSETRTLVSITSKEISEIHRLVSGDEDRIKKMCDHYGVEKIEDLALGQGFDIINKIKRPPASSPVSTQSDLMAQKIASKLQKAG